MAAGDGQGETGTEDTGRRGPAKRPEAGRRIREGAERPADEWRWRPQGQRVRPVPDGQPEEKDAGRVLQLDGVRPVFLWSGAVHGRDRRQHIRQRRVLRPDRAARRVRLHIPTGAVRQKKHAALGQPGHVHGLYTHHVPAPE